MPATSNFDSRLNPRCGATETSKLHTDLHTTERAVADSESGIVPVPTVFPRFLNWERPQVKWGMSSWD